MNTTKKPEKEIGVAFTEPGTEQMLPEDTIGTVWLGQANDRTGKRLFRGKINASLLPDPIDGHIHIILFPFTVGQQTGISVQKSQKHHGS